MSKYKIVRAFTGLPRYGTDGHLSYYRRTVKSGLTLEQAQKHCQDSETNSKTAVGAKARRISRRCPGYSWIDTYDEM